MRTGRAAAAAITLAITAACRANAGYVELPQFTVVHRDGGSVDDIYNYAAAVPAGRYYADGRFYISLIVTDDNAADGLSRLPSEVERVLFVGDVSAETLPIDPAVERVTYTGATPVDVAVSLSREWVKADEVVLAVYDEAATEEQVLALKYAAEVAAYKNAPLMFIEADAVPGGTLLAAAELGASTAYLFDFGGAASKRVLDVLARAGLDVEAELNDSGEATIFKEELIDLPPAGRSRSPYGV